LERVARRPLEELLHLSLLHPSGSDRFSPQELDAAEWRLQSDVVALGEIGVGLGYFLIDSLRSTLGLTPTIAFGNSLGEVAMHASLGTWSNPEAISERIRRHNVFQTRLQGPMHAIREAWKLPDALQRGTAGSPTVWTSMIVPRPADVVRIAIAGEPRVFLTQVNTPREVVMSGDPPAIERVVRQLGVTPIVAPLEFAFHCELVRSEAAALEEIYTLPLASAPGVRFFSGAQDDALPHDSRAVAQSLVETFCSTVDFPRLVETAYRSGARVFIELGPRRNSCDAIDAVLESRPHIGVPLDQKGMDAATSLLRSMARLITHRTSFDLSPLFTS
jgi:PfaB family protein